MITPIEYISLLLFDSFLSLLSSLYYGSKYAEYLIIV